MDELQASFGSDIRLCVATSSIPYMLEADDDAIAYDVMELSWFKEPVQCATGLVSAFIR